MGRILVIANQKGGVGKTTSVMNLGVALAEQGGRVLLVDLDPQGGLTAAFGLDANTVERSTYSLLMYSEITLARTVYPLRENLAIVPASTDLASAEVGLAQFRRRAHRLQMALDRSHAGFDFILLDTPPGLGVLTANGLVAAREVLVPVQCHYLAMRGVRALLDTIVRVKKRLNPSLRLCGLFGTMYRSDSEHSREVVNELRDVFGSKMFRSLISYDELVAEAPVAGMAVLEYVPDHAISQSYRSLAQEISSVRSF